MKPSRSSSHSATATATAPQVGPAARWVLGIVGGVLAAVGTVAVFVTENGPGAAALVTAGAALGALGVFANRIQSFEGAGMKVEMAAVAATLESAAQHLDDAGAPEAARIVRAEAADLMSLAVPLAARYSAARLTDQPRGARIAEQERVVRQWAELARTTSPTRDAVAALFATGDPSHRVGALAMMSAVPALADADVVTAAVRQPASSFEQYHALRVVEALLMESGVTATTSRLGDVVRDALDSGRLGAARSDRTQLARRLMAILDAELQDPSR